MSSWEAAVQHCLDSDELAELAKNSYYGDTVDCSKRYKESAEFKALQAFIPSKPGRALDLGAGNGILSWALASIGWDVTAVEPDPSALVGADAIRDLSIKTNTRIRVLEAFGEEIPITDAKFDLVIARQVLHHADCLSSFCKEIARLCESGGVVVTLRDHVISDPSQLQEFFDRHPLHRLYGGENAFMLSEYRAAFRGAGLNIKHELRSFESVINYDPLTPRDIRVKLAELAGPFKSWVLPCIYFVPFRVLSLIASQLDRRPGRLVTFIATNR